MKGKRFRRTFLAFLPSGCQALRWAWIIGQVASKSCWQPAQMGQFGARETRGGEELGRTP